ncbi:MAG: hypothetical protein V6Z86_07815 [Hyphomicrobiales bacterium]
MKAKADTDSTAWAWLRKRPASDRYRGDLISAAAEFPKWRFAKGKVLAGLIRRRAAERALFGT